MTTHLQTHRARLPSDFADLTARERQALGMDETLQRLTWNSSERRMARRLCRRLAESNGVGTASIHISELPCVLGDQGSVPYSDIVSDRAWLRRVVLIVKQTMYSIRLSWDGERLTARASDGRAENMSR